MIFECCVGCYEDAKIAEKRGANRIELCDNLLEGGTTPSYGTIRAAVENINIPINVIIRPRGGNFTYTQDEKNIMYNDIKLCKDLGVNAIVIGSLTNDNKIDKESIVCTMVFK